MSDLTFSGFETEKVGHVLTRQRCSYCNGTSRFIKYKCDKCEGHGAFVCNVIQTYASCGAVFFI